MATQRVPVEFDHVLAAELQDIAARRAATGHEDADNPGRNLFGIALSGGGIRSATINLGFLEVLKDCGILQKADYLSTVSGGGYTGGYIQCKLHETGSFGSLFSQGDIDYLRNNGDYLTPGRHGRGFMSKVRLAGAFVASLIMNLVWVALLVSLILSALALLAEGISITALTHAVHWALLVSIAALGVHYFFHFLRHVRLWSSNVLNYAEGILLVLLVGIWLLRFAYGFDILQYTPPEAFVFSALGLGLTGFFGNPNILTMHRFYRDRLASAFLDAAARTADRIHLHKLSANRGAPSVAPYALFNTCLNLLGRDDEKFAGVKVSDYYLLSPRFVGSRATGYERTDGQQYRRMTVSTAVAVSGAALNPNMGTRTNRVLTFLMTILNLQLGYWAPNPAYRGEWNLPVTWWPYYLLLQLLCRTDSTRSKINLSDGGHIENLAVYELLRRKCRLIIAIDAGEDPKYGFADLNNLVVRARNELGVTITFRPGHAPEDRIRPSPSSGFSMSDFAIADVGELPHEDGTTPAYRGLLVYVKSSLVKPETVRSLAQDHPNYWSTKYKMYHPQFPHESTADQFFDPDQWDAYHVLGRFMAGDLLGVDVRDSGTYARGQSRLARLGIDGLMKFFSGRK